MSWVLKFLLFVTLSPSKDISKYNQHLAGIPTLPSLTFWTLDRSFEKRCWQCAGHHLSGNQEPYPEITNIHFKPEEAWNFNYSSVKILYWQLFFLYMSQAWGLICTKTLQQSACCAVSLLTSSTWLFSIKIFTVFSVWETICCHKIHWRVNIKPVIKSALYKWIHHSCCHGPKMWFSLKQRAFWVASPLYLFEILYRNWESGLYGAYNEFIWKIFIWIYKFILILLYVSSQSLPQKYLSDLLQGKLEMLGNHYPMLQSINNWTYKKMDLFSMC